jgi:hypothetical protein
VKRWSRISNFCRAIRWSSRIRAMLPLGHVPVRSVGLFFLATAFAQAQISTSAYRVLGQPDLHQNSVNMVLGVELNAPSGIAIDGRGGQVHVYVSDTRNSRVLAWQDARSYQIGDPPSLVLGQPGPQYSRPLGIGLKGFNAPLGLAVDAGTECSVFRLRLQIRPGLNRTQSTASQASQATRRALRRAY